MKNHPERRLADLMKIEQEQVAPPAGLIDEIVNQIPAQLPVMTGLPEDAQEVAVADRGLPSRVAWMRLAATLTALLLSGALAYRLWLEPTSKAPVEVYSPVVVAELEQPASVTQQRDAVRAARRAADLPALRQTVTLEQGQRTLPSPSPPPSPSPKARMLPVFSEIPKPAPLVLPSQPVGSMEETIVVTGELPSVLAASEVSTTYDFEAVNRLRAQQSVVTVSTGGRALTGGQESTGGQASTGGTHEPNDAAFGDVFFKASGTNPFIDTEEDHLSTFGLDVDSASFSLVRTFIGRGLLPPPEAVRVEEVLNYFDFGLEAPESGDFAIHIDGGPTPFATAHTTQRAGKSSRYRLLRIGLRARDIERSARKPAVLTFVIDTSGSMGQQNRLGLVKNSLFLLLKQLNPQDQVALVEYGDRGRVLLEPTHDRSAIHSAIWQLRPKGSTNAAEGLELGYQLAAKHFRGGGINRVILCSDGVANVGPTGPDSILKLISQSASVGIELSTIGFGMGNYNDVLMEQLADRGDGNYAYVDSLIEAERIFVSELNGLLQTVAAESKVQVEFDPDVVERYRLLGYENRDIADHSFRDNKVDAGEIGAGHTVTALYEIRLKRSFPPRQQLGTLRLRYRPLDKAEFIEIEQPLSRRQLVKSWAKMRPEARLAAVVAEFAEILRGSYWSRGSTLEALSLEADALAPYFGGDEKFIDLRRLIRQAARIEEAKREEAP